MDYDNLQEEENMPKPKNKSVRGPKPSCMQMFSKFEMLKLPDSLNFKTKPNVPGVSSNQKRFLILILPRRLLSSVRLTNLIKECC